MIREIEGRIPSTDANPTTVLRPRAFRNIHELMHFEAPDERIIGNVDETEERSRVDQVFVFRLRIVFDPIAGGQLARAGNDNKGEEGYDAFFHFFNY